MLRNFITAFSKNLLNQEPQIKKPLSTLKYNPKILMPYKFGSHKKIQNKIAKDNNPLNNKIFNQNPNSYKNLNEKNSLRKHDKKEKKETLLDDLLDPTHPLSPLHPLYPVTLLSEDSIHHIKESDPHSKNDLHQQTSKSDDDSNNLPPTSGASSSEGGDGLVVHSYSHSYSSGSNSNSRSDSSYPSNLSSDGTYSRSDSDNSDQDPSSNNESTDFSILDHLLLNNQLVKNFNSTWAVFFNIQQPKMKVAVEKIKIALGRRNILLT